MKEELYGLEALERVGLDKLQSTLASVINENGAIWLINQLLDTENLPSEYRDELFFIKNTIDLSDTNLVLNELLNSSETLLDDTQIELVVEALAPEEPEEEFSEYEEPDNWDEVDSSTETEDSSEEDSYGERSSDEGCDETLNQIENKLEIDDSKFGDGKVGKSISDKREALYQNNRQIEVKNSTESPDSEEEINPTENDGSSDYIYSDDTQSLEDRERICITGHIIE